MAAERTLREWMERITKLFSRNFRCRASPNFPMPGPAHSPKKSPGHFWSGPREKLNVAPQLLLLLRMIKFLAARKGAAVKEVFGFGAA